MNKPSTPKRSAGDAELLAVLCLVLCAVVLLTYLAIDSINRASCNDYGKLRIFGAIYDCKPEVKK